MYREEERQREKFGEKRERAKYVKQYNKKREKILKLIEKKRLKNSFITEKQ